jgi:formate hydrogenlyase subunit 3/multisubunit Na+/H+ antiporter MnhD subunit
MSPINLQQLLYCLCYIPLIGSMFCLLFTYQNIAFYIAIACFSAILIALGVFLLFFFTSQNSLYLLDLNYLSNISSINIIFLLIITAIFLVILLFYRHNIYKNLSEKQQSIFYALILINFFNIIGIITTHHLLKLYLFIEVYSLGCLAIISFDNNKQIKQFNFDNYSDIPRNIYSIYFY